MVISVSSGGFQTSENSDTNAITAPAYFTLNNIPVEMPTSNESNNSHRSLLSLLIINQSNGKILDRKVFDTYKSSDELDAYIRDLSFSGTCIVAATGEGDWFKNLSDAAV